MKLIKMMVLYFICSAMLTGCTSFESPERLVEAPEYNEDIKKMYSEIEKLIPNNSSLTLPKNSKEVSSINKVDLDSNGVYETVVFEKKNPSNNGNPEVGFLILKEDYRENYTLIDNVLAFGDDIKYANFYDLNNDGNKEIIMVYNTGGQDYINIYNLNDGKIELVGEISTKEILGKNFNSEIMITIGNLDNDNLADIVILCFNKDKQELIVNLAYFDNNIKIVDSVIFESVKNLQGVYTKIDNIKENTKGIILDIPLTDNMYTTQFLYNDDNVLKRSFDDYNNTLKPYYIKTEDIDKNGIVDIAKVEQKGNTYVSKNANIITFYEWNEFNEIDKLKFNKEWYYNYLYNFKFKIPQNVAGKIVIEETGRGEIRYFTFKYVDMNETVELFTIVRSDKTTSIEDSKGSTKTTNSINLSTTDKYNFIATINNKAKAEALGFTQENIKENFKVIY